MAADTEHVTVVDHQPDDNFIWRYLDLPKLIDLLQTQSLHFARVSLLKEDPFEGWFTEGDSKLLLRHFTAVKTNGKEEEEHARNMLEVIVHSGKNSAYINCWHAGDAESVALWKQYGTEAGAMAIQSTYEKLASAFPDDPEKTVYMGMIKYKNLLRSLLISTKSLKRFGCDRGRQSGLQKLSKRLSRNTTYI